VEAETLRNLGSRVLSQFGVTSHALRSKASQQSEADNNAERSIENLNAESERFQLWAANLGLHATGDISLDYRVQDSPSVKSYAGQLLEELAEDLSDRNAHSRPWRKKR
jgi:hypothetical protein